MTLSCVQIEKATQMRIEPDQLLRLALEGNTTVRMLREVLAGRTANPKRPSPSRARAVAVLRGAGYLPKKI